MRQALWAALALGVIGCSGEAQNDQGVASEGTEQRVETDGAESIVRIPVDPYPSSYTAPQAQTTLIRGATVYDGAGGVREGADVLMEDGRIAEVGEGLTAPDGAVVMDAQGKVVTPGIIDIHSHLGVYPSPEVSAHSDGNEISGYSTPGVFALHGLWPQDPGFARALAGGVTTLHVLPGSANLFGGRGVTVRNVPARTAQAMKFPDAPYSLKMACGENPKRVYGYGSGRFPGGFPYSRMGNVEGYRIEWQRAVEYKRKWDDYQAKAEAGEDVDPPSRDLDLDTLKAVLEGDILVHMHCYRADEMGLLLNVADEFGYQIASFHHAVEAYKIPDLLAQAGTCSSVWADWWGFKMESYDGVRENASLIHAGGACAVIHSDDDIDIQRLNQEAAKTWADGQRLGLDIPKEEAMTWLFLNPARALGIDDAVGSLEPGKRGDVVIWNRDPFSVYAKAEQVFLDGVIMYDRTDPTVSPRTDFEVGQLSHARSGGAGQ